MLKIIANRLELLSAAQDADKIAPATSPLPILGCAYLAVEDSKLTVAATNLELALERRVPVTVQEEGAIAIESRLLVDMLRLLEGDTVTITQEQERTVSIKAGEAHYTIILQDAAEYPRLEIPFPEDTVAVTGIPAMARRTVFAVSTEDNKPLLKCVRLAFIGDGLRAVSSDGARIASAKGQSKGGNVNVLLPATSLDKLAQLLDNQDQVRVGLTGNSVVFFKEDFAFSARVLEGQYADTDRVLGNTRASFILLTDAEAMRQAVSSAYLIQSDHARFSMEFLGDVIKMHYDSEYGESDTELPVVALTGAPAGVYWYHPGKLLECLRALRGNIMLEVVQQGALVMRTDDLICMQMATREPKKYEPKPVVTEPSKEKKPKEKKPKKTAAKKKKQPDAPEKKAA